MPARLGPWVVCTFAVVIAGFSHAQSYPNRPIRLIVPSAPGGSPGISARMFSQEISRQVGQQIVVDNRAGASNTTGSQMLAKAPPDGYTIGYAVFSRSTNPSLMPNMRYDALRGLQMVIRSTSTPNILTVAAISGEARFIEALP